MQAPDQILHHTPSEPPGDQVGDFEGEATGYPFDEALVSVPFGDQPGLGALLVDLLEDEVFRHSEQSVEGFGVEPPAGVFHIECHFVFGIVDMLWRKIVFEAKSAFRLVSVDGRSSPG